MQPSMNPSRKTKLLVHPNLCNITLLNVTLSLISQKPRERMFSVQISFLIVTFASHVSWVSTLKQSTKDFKPHARTHHVVIVVIICHYCCNVDFVLFRNVIRYIDSLLSCIHVNTTHLLNITCTLVDMCVILWRLECTLIKISVGHINSLVKVGLTWVQDIRSSLKLI